jgi:hypothetical protein
MLAIFLCLAAFAVCYWAGKRSLGIGLTVLFAVGYFYGILRANVLASMSHFIFDAGLLGLYLSQRWTTSDPQEVRRLYTIRLWALILIIWPALLVLLPFQPLLVSLVGLRGSIFFLPVLYLGARLKSEDMVKLSCGLALLNMAALGFALGEYFLGVPRFYPVSPVTQIIYSSTDVAGGYFRIPATFVNAHSYGGMMDASLPFLIGLWRNGETRVQRYLAGLGILAASGGVLLCATRLNFIMASVILLAMVTTTKMTARSWVILLLVVGGLGALAVSNDRLQRFETLSNTDYVGQRISGSVNRSFFEILFEYPMGNGLGGGGTSLPYFLESQVRNPIGMENEYARILCEQGIIGFLMWAGFILWFLSQLKKAYAKGAWSTARKLAWWLSAISLATGWIGLGLLTAIPSTAMLMLSMGWAAVPLRWSESVPERNRLAWKRDLRPRSYAGSVGLHQC